MAETGEMRENHCRIHVHAYETETEVAQNHQHMITGVSAPARIVGDSHVHRLRIRTTFYVSGMTGHWHWIDITTGPAVPLPDGSHVHYFAGVTSVDDAHSHSFAGATALGPTGFLD